MKRISLRFAPIACCAVLALSLGLGCLLNSAEAQATLTDEVTAEDAQQLPWRGSLLAWSHGATKNSFDEGSQLSYNPTYAQTLTLAPRWYFLPEFSLRLRQDIIIEVTKPDVYQQRVVLTDTVLDGVYSTHLKQLWDLDVAVGPRLKVPLSLTSQANDRYLGAGLRLDVGRTFQQVAHGLAVTFRARYNHYFVGSNVALTDDAQACQLANGESSTLSYGCLGGGSNISDDLYTGLEVAIAPLSMMTVTAGFGITTEGARELSAAEVTTATGVEQIGDSSATHLRHSTLAELSVGFQVTPWLELAAGAATGAPQKAENGTQRNPLWSYETELSATATLLIDELYLATQR